MKRLTELKEFYLEFSGHLFLDKLSFIIQLDLCPVWHFLCLLCLHVLTDILQAKHFTKALEGGTALTELFIVPSNFDGFKERF